jgi:hypothetical protein
MLPQVFISHTGSDEQAKTFAASILRPALQAAGLPVFMDFSDLVAGDEWPSKLVNAASNSQIVVAVLSKQYPTRFWCMYELYLARQRELEGTGGGWNAPLVIPVFYDAVKDVCPRDNSWEQQWSPSGKLYSDANARYRHLINAKAWAGNLTAMVTHVQAIRRKQPSQAPSKDEDLRVALEVVSACIKSGRLPPPVDVGYVVGFDKQLTDVASELVGGLTAEPRRLGAWLHGSGEASQSCCKC